MNTADRPLHDANGEGALRYSAALLQASGPVPDEHVDWEAFHAKLAARAERSLAGLRYPHVVPNPPARPTAPIRPRPYQRPITVAWWEPAARWSRLVVGASVAAGIVLIMVVRASPKDLPDARVGNAATAGDQVDGTRVAFESAAIGRAATWTIDSGVLPSAADLLIPLGGRGASR